MMQHRNLSQRRARAVVLAAAIVAAFSGGDVRAWEASPGQVDAFHRITGEYETPHTEWAKPYARGRLRVLYLVGAGRGRQGMGTQAREGVEFGQRFDVHLELVFWHDFYGQQWLGGNSGNFRLLNLMRQSWDVFVFQGVSPAAHPRYGGDDAAKKLLREAVTGGAGMVLLDTDDGGFFTHKQPLEERPAALAPLAPTAVFTVGKGRVVHVGARPKIPYRLGWDVEYDDWQQRLGRAVLWAAHREPAATVTAALPAGEIAQARLPQTIDCTWHGVRAPAAEWQARLRRWDGQQRSLGTAACKTPQGHFALELPPLVAGDYHLDLWLRGPDGVEGWSSTAFKVRSESEATISVTSGHTLSFHQVEKNREAQLAADTAAGVLTPYFEIGEALTGSVAVTGPAAGKQLRVQLRDRDERILQRQVLDGRQAPVFHFDVAAWMPMLLRLEAVVGADGRDVTAASTYVRVVKRRRGRFNFVLWGYPTDATLAPLAARRLRQMGVTAITDRHPAPLSAAAYGLAWVPWTGGNVTGRHLAAWTEVAKDAEKGVGNYFAKHTGRSRPHGVLAYSLGDEGATSGFGRGPGATARFRDYLRRTYPSVAALNTAWHTTYEGFDRIGLAPPAAAATAAAYDRWAFGFDNFVGMAEDYRARLRRVDPAAWIGFEGSGGFGGDPDLFCRRLDFWVPYAGGIEQVIRSVAPRRFIRSSWMGYHWTADGLLSSYWRLVTNGCDSIWWWMWSASWPWNGFQRPELDGGIEATEDMLRDTRIVRDGLGDLLLRYTMLDDDIAILYSMPSTYAVGLTPKKTSPYIRRVEWAHYSWWTIIRDLGLQFRYVTDRQLRRGEFQADRCKVLILPQAIAIGEKEAGVIRKFVSRGGTVIADFHPGIYDGHANGPSTGCLDDLFGIAGDATARLDEAALSVDGTIGENKLTFGKPGAAVDTTVTVTDGTALGSVGDHPAFIVKTVGKGRAMLLNVPIWHLAPPRNPPRGMAGVASAAVTEHAVGVLFQNLFTAAGVAPTVGLRPYKNPSRIPFVANLNVQRWRNGEIELLSLFRPVGTVTKGAMVNVSLPNGPKHVYALKNGVDIGRTGYWFTRIRPSRALFYALLPAASPAPTLELPATAARGTAVTARLRVPGARGLHAVRLRARTPTDAVAESWQQTVIVGDRPETVTLPVAFNDPAGTWTITLNDLFTPRRDYPFRLRIR